MNLFHEVELADPHAKGRLLLHSMPGRFEPLAEFVAAVDAEDIYCILCLVSDAEIKRKSPDYLGWLKDEVNAKRVVRVPIEDFGVPGDLTAFQRSMDILAAALEVGGSVLIHCAAGVSRTGTAAVCLLTDLGLDAEEAMELVSEAHSEPETDEQGEFIQQYAANWSKQNRG